MYFPSFDIRTLIVELVVFGFAITIHEYAHAWTANFLGDPTAKYEGRITLNPLAHLDPIGTLCLIFAGFGWGRPVPVNPYNFDKPTRDNMIVAAAGPTSNFISALGLGLCIRVLLKFPPNMINVTVPALMVLKITVQISLLLAFFNLIPLFPLDGASVLHGLLPARAAQSFERTYRYGPMILILLIIFGSVGHVSIIWSIIGPPTDFFSQLFMGT